MKLFYISLLIFSVLGLASGLDDKKPPKMKTQKAALGARPCKKEAEKLCPGFHWGDGLGQCLKDHETELSDSCRIDLSSKAKAPSP